MTLVKMYKRMNQITVRKTIAILSWLGLTGVPALAQPDPFIRCDEDFADR